MATLFRLIRAQDRNTLLENAVFASPSAVAHAVRTLRTDHYFERTTLERLFSYVAGKRGSGEEDVRTMAEAIIRALQEGRLVAVQEAFGIGHSLPPGPAPGPSPVPPPPTPAPEAEKALTAKWGQDKAYCGDEVHLLGDAKNLGGSTAAQGTLAYTGQKPLGTLDGKGEHHFDLPWNVIKGPFMGMPLPEAQELEASLAAGGLKAYVPRPLKIFRAPDIAETPITFARSSPPYAWSAAFRAALTGDGIEIRQTLELKTAWLGKWVKLDPTKDKTQLTWAFVKKVATTWKFWDSSSTDADKWKPLPRSMASYTVNNMFFVKSGSDFVDRTDSSRKWPEAFPEPANLEDKKKAWLKNIHEVWDKKFALHREGCKSTAKNCCAWKLKVTVNWSDKPGDKTVYAVWASEWERSNAKDWYLTESRLGVAAHECGHLLGAYDEYSGGAIDPASKKIDDDTIMGANLTRGLPRHLDGMRDELAKIIQGKVPRSWKFLIKDA